MLTEEALISYIQKIFPKIKGNHFGIGDDAAVLDLSKYKKIVVSTDSIVENTHFKREWSSPRDLALKTLHTNLSDIAAMGAKAWCFFLNLKIAKNENSIWLKNYLRELARESRRTRCSLMGGNIARSEKGFSADVTILGQSPTKEFKMRSGAGVNDLICVGAPLGLSLAGYKLLSQSKNRKFTLAENYLIKQHLQAHAQSELGQILSLEKAVTAMMDVSDGLAQDLPKLLKASGCGAQIHFEAFPIHSSLKKVSIKRSWNPHEIFWVGGEDYKLLFTIKEKSFHKIKEKLAKKGLPIFAIGQCTKGRSLKIFSDKKMAVSNLKSFSHF